MLIISRKKLYITRFLMWGGLVMVAFGVISYLISSSYANISIVLMAAGLCVSLLGATLLRRLFRCPNCKKNMLPDSSGIDIRSEKCPECCPHCGTKVQMKE